MQQHSLEFDASGDRHGTCSIGSAFALAEGSRYRYRASSLCGQERAANLHHRDACDPSRSRILNGEIAPPRRDRVFRHCPNWYFPFALDSSEERERAPSSNLNGTPRSVAAKL